MCVLHVYCVSVLRSVIASNPGTTWRGGGGICFWSGFSKFFFLSPLFQPDPDRLGGRRGAYVCVCLSVCRRLRVLIGGEKQITVRKFILCLTRAGFELRIGLGTEGPGEAWPAPWWEAGEDAPLPTGWREEEERSPLPTCWKEQGERSPFPTGWQEEGERSSLHTG